MIRNKARDDKYFNFDEEYEINYVAGLYKEKTKVRDFLKANMGKNGNKYLTHQELYKLIQKELGYPFPF